MENSNISIFVHYRPAELHEGNIWYINYYAIHPNTGKLKEKRIKFNKIKSITERRKSAKKVIQEINLKLQSGWNPWVENSAHKSFIILCDVLDTFLESKSRELRANSMRSYISFVKKFNEWLIKNDYSTIYAMNFTKNHAMNYLQNIEKQVSTNQTYNNYLRSCKVLFNWLVERQYITHNPFSNFNQKKKQNKTRIIIPPTIRNDIKKELEGKNDYFLSICLLVFGSLIRPNEISHLKKSNFDFKKQIVIIPPEVSKNGKLRVATIPNVNIEILKNYVSTCNDKNYVFGKKMKPGQKECPRKYSKLWAKLRDKLKLPIEMKLYSLRDSGIVDLLKNGVSPHDIMRLADHSDLSITTQYLPYAGLGGNEVIKNKSAGF